MFRKRKKFSNRERDEGVTETIIEAQEISEDPMEQFLWVKNHTKLSDQQKIITIVNLVQMNFNISRGQEVKLKDGHVDYLMRSMLDALRHLQEDLPTGVYKYIYNNAEETLEQMMLQRPIKRED